MIKKLLLSIGSLLAYMYPLRLSVKLRSLRKYITTGYLKHSFKSFGYGSSINVPLLLLQGAEYISVGRDCYIGRNVQLAAWDKVGDEHFSPSIELGDNCSIGDGSHVTCINAIKFGSGVRLGKMVLITDNAHGESDSRLMDLAPNKRPMFSKGPVIIEDNVWIGEKSSIMPNVRIGRGSIVGANSVATKDVPEYSIVAGVPAQLVKRLKN